jgi:hypothetical protein
MKSLFVLLCLVTAIFMGCAKVGGRIVNPDKGTVFEFSYIRIGGEKVQKIEVEAPGGWRVSITGVDVDAPISPKTFELLLESYTNSGKVL